MDKSGWDVCWSQQIWLFLSVLPEFGMGFTPFIPILLCSDVVLIDFFPLLFIFLFIIILRQQRCASAVNCRERRFLAKKAVSWSVLAIPSAIRRCGCGI